MANTTNVRKACKALYQLRDPFIRSKCLDLLRVVVRKKKPNIAPPSIEIVHQFVEYANGWYEANKEQLDRLEAKIAKIGSFQGYSHPAFIEDFHHRNSQELLSFYLVRNYFDEKHNYYWQTTEEPHQQKRAFNLVNNILVVSMSISRNRLQSNWKRVKKSQAELASDLLTIGIDFHDLLNVCSEDDDLAKNLTTNTRERKSGRR